MSTIYNYVQNSPRNRRKKRRKQPKQIRMIAVFLTVAFLCGFGMGVAGAFDNPIKTHIVKKHKRLEFDI